jgi:predicted nucleic-acid-binding protein
MTGVDTNVLVRYLVEDDEHQTKRVERFLQESRTAACLHFNRCAVRDSWALRSVFGKSRTEILSSVEQLIGSDIFQVEDADSVRKAVQLALRSKADFTDHLMGEIN